MSAPINQIQSQDDEDEDQTEERLLHDCNNTNSAIKELVQESFLSYYNRDFGQAQDFACFGGAVSTASKFSYERLINEGFDLPSSMLKARKRKADVVDGGGGDRVVRATGRKDRHSKVRTARGPRDRRVRLSPRTAIQFYDVQDRLGYDRPSKAIDWLINEAKTAIDALEEQPSIEFSELNVAEILSPLIPNHGAFSLSQRGIREKLEHLNDDGLVSGFSCFVDEAAAPPYTAALEAYLDQDFSSSRNRSEIIYPNSQHEFGSALNVGTNWEMGRLQKMFTWNSVNESSGSIRGGAEYSPPLQAAAHPISGHLNLFSQREPLQSSVINYSPMNNGVSEYNFSNELSKISGAAAMQQDQNLKKLLFSMPSNYQG